MIGSAPFFQGLSVPSRHGGFVNRFLVLLLIALPFAACECGEVLQGLPEPRIAVLDEEGNSSDDADPWLVVDFADADSGAHVLRTLKVKNTGTGQLTVKNVCVVNAPDAAAALGASCLQTSATPFSFPNITGVYKPGAEVDLPVDFSPQQGGPVSLFLRVRSDAADEPNVAVQLTGRGTDGRLCADAPVLDFGDVDVGESKTMQVTLENCGVKPVSIDTFTMGANPDDAFLVQIAGAAPATPIGPLAEGERVVLDVTFTPARPVPYRDTTAGTADLTTAAPYVGAYTLMFVGDGRSPPACRVNVVPATLNFGAVASGASSTQQFAIQSVGECACQVTAISEPAPAGAGFALASTPTLPLTLKGTRGCDGDPAGSDAAPGILLVDVAYTSPERDVPLADNATIDVTTSDEAQPVRAVALEANGGGAPYCQLEVVPQGGGSGLGGLLSASGRWGVVAFGRTSVHIEKRLPIEMTNVGNTTCNVTRITYDANTTANEFRLEEVDGSPAQMAATAIAIAPGQTRAWMAVFAPTRLPEGGAIPFPTLSSGYDGASGEGFFCTLQRKSCNGVVFVTDDTRTDVSDSEQPQGTYSIGFAGTPVKPEVEIIPGELDFGLVTLDCGSPEQRVTVYNVGSGDLVVEQPVVDPATTPPTFEVTATTAGSFPHTIPPGGSMAIKVRFYARTTGVANGTLIIPTVEAGQQGAPVTVLMRGEGTLESETTDVFDQMSDPKVDVLWVVDDSGSMGPFQQLLAQNFPQFFSASNVDQADYHIAVTTTLTVDASCVPDLQGNTNCEDHAMSGHWTACANNDRFITPTTNDPAGEFGCNVKVSDDANVRPSRPHSDSAEGGLRAAFNFLSAPKIDDPAMNGGFLRDDAKLHVIMVVDEPEQSKGPVDLYVDFFKNLKGFRNSALVAVSAIATDPGGCTLPDGTQIPDPGTRYQEVVTEMNGRWQSICESDWSGMMGQLGLDSVGLQVEFFLSRAADPSGLSVCVRQTGPSSPCTPVAMAAEGAATGWFYDPEANSIVFNAGSVPPRGARIEVDYQAACY